MARARVLNPDPRPATAPAIELSQRLLASARAVEGRDACAEVTRLAGELHGVDPGAIDGDAARIAFWLNLYNALIRHRLCLEPLSGNLLWHVRLFDRDAYRVGEHAHPLNVIENGLLRGNRRPPYRPRRALRRSDPRLAAAPSHVDARIHFALNCGARSCPPIRAYEPESLDAQLEFATKAYLTSEARFDPERRRLRLPGLLRLYSADFGPRSARLELAARHLPELRGWLERGGGRLRVGYTRFDWTVTAGG